MSRNLVTVRNIGNLAPIPGADQIEVAEVDGWKCVVKKGEFKVGDQCLYLEIDSLVPATHPEFPQFHFLEKNAKYEKDGYKFARIRTIKLRKQISQGLALPLSMFPDLFHDNAEMNAAIPPEDLANHFFVTLYEPPQVSIGGPQRIQGNFPIFIPKTDQERVQNMFQEIKNRQNHVRWDHEKKELIQLPNDKVETYEVSIKMDGTSVTIYRTVETNPETNERIDHFGVCSKNWEIEEDKDNKYWDAALQYNLKDKLFPGYAIQGEICGPGIQHNNEKLKDLKLFVYNVYDIDRKQYLSPDDCRKFCEFIQLEHVPVLHEDFEFTFENIQEVLDFADGKSYNPDVNREGLVFKSNSSDFSFKVISNKYLLENDE